MTRFDPNRDTASDAPADLLDELDPHFAALYAGYVARLGERSVLDRRTTSLLRVGRLTCLRHEPGLRRAVAEAIAAEVPPAEVLDVILQCTVVAGDVVLEPALAVFRAAVVEAGRVDELVRAQLPLTGTDSTRSLSAEADQWHPDDANDPRRTAFIERYGWLGVSTGLRLRPHHMLDLLEYLDSLDPSFTAIWLDYCYHGMYSRGVLDDRTRLMCQAADCFAVGHHNQAKAHLRGVLRHGGTPRELMEMIFQGITNLGMPTTFAALKVLLGILTEDGLLDQLGSPVLSATLQRTVG